MTPMSFYPVYLRLQGRRCLVAGLGGVGRRKLCSLLDAGAEEVLALDPGEPDARLRSLLEKPGVHFAQRRFQESDLEGCFLACIATPDRNENDRIAHLCRERGVLCNVADAPDAGDFIVPAQACCGDLRVAVSTAGHSPALARRIKQDLQDYLGLRYASFLALMGRLRPLILGLGRPTAENSELFRALVDSPLADALQRNDADRARELLEELLPQELHPGIDEVLHELP